MPGMEPTQAKEIATNWAADETDEQRRHVERDIYATVLELSAPQFDLFRAIPQEVGRPMVVGFAAGRIWILTVDPSEIPIVMIKPTEIKEWSVDLLASRPGENQRVSLLRAWTFAHVGKFTFAIEAEQRIYDEGLDTNKDADFAIALAGKMGLDRVSA